MKFKGHTSCLALRVLPESLEGTRSQLLTSYWQRQKQLVPICFRAECVNRYYTRCYENVTYNKPSFQPLFGLQSIVGFELYKALYFFYWENLERVLKNSQLDVSIANGSYSGIRMWTK